MTLKLISASIASIGAFFMANTIQAATPAEAQPQQSLVFNDLATQCASHVDASTLQAIVRTESSFNPFAIGVVRGSVKQPKTFDEAVKTAKALHAEGKNFSMGLAQINRYNLDKYGLDYESVFDVCKNLQTGADILAECYGRAPAKNGQAALQEALSCYYSGNFRTGFGYDLKGLPSYVERILSSAKKNTALQEIQPPIKEDKEPISEPKPTVPAIDANAKPVKITVKATSNASAKGVNKPIKIKETSSDKDRMTASWDAFGEW